MFADTPTPSWPDITGSGGVSTSQYLTTTVPGKMSFTGSFTVEATVSRSLF